MWPTYLQCTVSWICGATFPTAMTTNNAAVFLLQRCWKPQVKWQSEAGRSAPLGQTCCAGGSRNRGGEDGGVHVWSWVGGETFWGLRRWWGCPCKLTLWPPVSKTHTHTYTCLEVETGKQAKKGRKTVYSSHSEPYNSQSKDTQIAASEKVREERSRCVVEISTTECDGFLDLPWFWNRFLFCLDLNRNTHGIWNKRLGDYEAESIGSW